ncbi:hypothetical protein JTE90_016905 [Oedothorax gibbosus]|uniref:Cytochrome P450 n=1 Tax=Oedothorax gibbosus TaxID=931172 RepID=A0AAV6UV30_9ARAC|nr:hypothetical protein JTE90_016905 [Oedothorax gibbosus]
MVRYRSSTVTVANEESTAKAFASIPGPTRLPVIGNLHLFSRFGPYSFDKLYDAYADLHKQYGPVVRLDLGIKMLLLFSPEDIKKLFYLGERYPNRPMFEALRHYRLKRSDAYSCGGLVSENGEQWGRLRKAVNFIMVPQFSQSYFTAQAGVAEDFVSRIHKIADSGREVKDFIEELYRYTEEAIGLICFGKRLGLMSTSGPQQEFSGQLSRAADDTMQALADSLLSFPWWKIFPTPTYKRLVRSQEFFRRFAEKCVQEAENKLQEPGQDSGNELKFLQRLFEDKMLKRSDIILLMTEIFSSGIDATGNAIGFTLYNLSKKPEVQEKLYQDIQKHSMSGLSTDSISKMIYLKACIQESHRLTPASGGIARILQSTAVLSGFQVPENVLCIGLQPIISLQEQHFSDPLDFKPERWLNANQTQYTINSHPYCVLPFSHGIRRCVGQRFAEQEIRLCLIKIIQNFRVEYEGPDIGSRMRLSLVPDKPLNLKFIKR